MSEKVCHCEPGDNERTEKTEGAKTKEKLRLFSRKKSNSLNKNVCSKCGLSFANESQAEFQNVLSKSKPDEASIVQGTLKEPKKSRRQSEELPQIPVPAEYQYHYERTASDVGDCIYTEIEEPPEKPASAPPDPLQGSRRRPVSAGGRVQPGGQLQSAHLSNGGFKNVCHCPKCRSQRGQDLTVELLPMDTQITLQSMMQGSTLMCNLL